MKLYAAPMEGITGFPFRNVHNDCFGMADRYYSPFLVMNQHYAFKNKEMRDIDPLNNAEIDLIPQILGNDADQFVWAIQTIAECGYREINFNLGCPYKTVVNRHKGSGLLAEPDRLDRLFSQVFDRLKREDVTISVKTRLGIDETEEIEDLLPVFNRYPFAELIVHPRVQKDFYGGKPDLGAFAYVLENSKHPVCYNGDVKSVSDYQEIIQRFPVVSAVMIGRGMLADPALFRQIKGGKAASKEELWVYQALLFDAYRDLMGEDKNALYKMKEIWDQMSGLFADSGKCLKMIRKAVTRAQYEEAMRRLFDTCELKTEMSE